MKKLINYFAIVVLLIMASGCGNGYSSRMITRADSLMEANQDSARAALVMLDSLRPQYQYMSKKEQMYYELIYAKGMNKGYVVFKTDSVMKRVVDYYKTHGSAEEQMMAHYLLGCAYRDMEDMPAALENYLDATECADTVTNKAFLARIYGQIGNLYLNQLMPKNAISAFSNAQRYAWEANDTLTSIIAKENQINAFAQLDDLNQMIRINDEVYKNYMEYGYKREAARCLGNVLEALVLTKQYAKARKSMDIYERESGYFDGKEIPSISYSSYFYAKSMYCMAVCPDSARYYLQKCATYAHNTFGKFNSAYAWYQYYHKIGNKDSLQKYADLYMDYSTQLSRSSESDNIQKMNALYNYNRWKVEAKNSEQEAVNKSYMNRFLIILLLVVLLAFVITGIFYNKYSKKKEQLNEEEMNILKLQVIKRREELRAEKRKLNNLEKENSEKTDEIQKMEARILDLQEEIEALNCDFENDEIVELCENRQSLRAIFIKFSQLAEHKRIPTRKQWEVFDEAFEALFPGYVKILEKYNPLTERELHLCMLIWLGFAPKQLAILLDTTGPNVGNMRKRLGLKVFGEDMGTSEFDKMIRGIQYEGYVD